MSAILDFKNWSRLNEDATTQLSGSTPDDLAALDTIQLMADRGPAMYNRFGNGKAMPAETLITRVGSAGGDASQMGLSTGAPTKTIEFSGSTDPDDPKVKKSKYKATFYSKEGKLYATVWKNGVLTLNGLVEIKNHGQWKQITAIGSNTGYTYVADSGVQPAGDGSAAPVSAGIIDVMYNGAGGNKDGIVEAVIGLSRGASNVPWSKGSVTLANYVKTERAKANPTQAAPKA